LFTATKELVEKYARTFAAHHVRLREAEELIRKPNAEKALQLKAKYRDAAIVRAMLDEVIDMMKESAKKRGDAATLQALEQPLDIRNAIQALKPRA